MKILKPVLTVLLVIMIVIIGLATELTALFDLTLINPLFYKSALRVSGFYKGVGSIFENQIYAKIDSQEAITENYKDEAYNIADETISDKEFSKAFAEFISGTVKFVFYGKGDGNIPIDTWIELIEQKTSDSEIAYSIVDDEIENGTISEDERDYYYEEYERVIIATMSSTFNSYSSYASGYDNFSEALYAIVAPTEELVANFEGRFWVIRYWIRRLIAAVFIGLALVALFTFLLFLLFKKNKKKAFVISMIIMAVNGICAFIGGIALFFGVSIANSMGYIPEAYASYSVIVKELISPIAFIVLVFGIIFLLVPLYFFIKNKKNKSSDKDVVEDDVVTEDIKEIDYTETSEITE